MNPVHPFERSLRREVVGRRLLVPGERVVVAVSGGPDSTALLLGLCALASGGGFPLDLAVAHVNHGLRGAASDRDAAEVAARARALGLEVFIERSDEVAPDAANLEAVAREQRYRRLARVAAQWAATAVALGHTLDDQAETVLLRLARGGGAASLAGMEWRRRDGIVRPLLGLRREDCRAYLESCGVTAAHDESNTDLRFTRNRVRHELLPLLARHLGVDMHARLADLASELRVEASLADRAIAPLLASASADLRENEPSLAVWSIAAAGEAAGRLVHAWLAGQGLRPSRAQIAQIVRGARGARPGASVDLAGGARVVRRYDRLVLTDRSDLSTRVISLQVPGRVDLESGWSIEARRCPASRADPARGCANRAAARDSLELRLDADVVSLPLAVRRAAPGDRIRLAAGHRKLSDVFIDGRVPRDQRAAFPVVVSGDETVLWVPGIVRTVLARPSSNTDAILELRAVAP